MGVALAVAAMTVLGDAHAASRDAQKLVREAESAFVHKRFDEALEHYRAARGLVEEAEIVYMIARCHEELGNLEAALEHFEVYLVDGNDARIRQRALAAARALRRRLEVGRLILQVEPFGAEVSVNGEVRGQAPIGPLSLGAGRHEVSVRALGFISQRTAVSLQGGDERELVVTLAAPHTPGFLDFPRAPVGASVRVDGLTAGSLPRPRLALEPGGHHIEITTEAEGVVWSGHVTLSAGERINLTRLVAPHPTPEPFDPGPWDTIALVSGALLVAGGGVGLTLAYTEPRSLREGAGVAPGLPASRSQLDVAKEVELWDTVRLLSVAGLALGGALVVTGIGLGAASSSAPQVQPSIVPLDRGVSVLIGGRLP